MELIIKIDRKDYDLAYDLVYGINPTTHRERIYKAIANGTPYNPSGDCISREALKEAISKVVAEERKEDPMWANGLRYALTIINEAQTVEHSLLPLASEADNAYMRGYEVGKAEGIMKASARQQGKKKPVFKSVPTFCKYEDYHDAEQYVQGWNDAMRFIFGIEER